MHRRVEVEVEVEVEVGLEERVDKNSALRGRTQINHERFSLELIVSLDVVDAACSSQS